GCGAAPIPPANAGTGACRHQLEQWSVVRKIVQLSAFSSLFLSLFPSLFLSFASSWLPLCRDALSPLRAEGRCGIRPANKVWAEVSGWGTGTGILLVCYRVPPSPLISRIIELGMFWPAKSRCQRT